MARSFDGVDDGIDCGVNDNIFTETGACSFWAWVTGSTGSFVSRSADTAGPNFIFSSAGGSNRRLNFKVDGSTDLLRQSNSYVPGSGRRHVAFTWDGSMTAANVHIYLDGVEVTYAATTNGASPVDNSGASLRFGLLADSTGDWNGLMQHVGMTNAVLTAAQLNLCRWWGWPGGAVQVKHPWIASKLANEGTESADGTASGTTVAAFATPCVRPGMGLGW